MTRNIQAAGRPAQPRIQVPLNALGLAPENLRAEAPEDAEVPRLAETIRAAGLIYPPIVRRGRKGEADYMVLDGRRRRFALLRLAEAGAIPADHPVECLLAEDRAAQAAGAVLPNAEHAPVHLADVIVAIGKLRRSRLTVRGVAEALGYDEIEVKRLEALAEVHEDVLKAFRLGKLSLRQVRLFARLKDRAKQGELVQDALCGHFYEYAVQSLVSGGRVTLDDPRFGLVPEADYAAAGGRLAGDLFDELPTEALDPEVLETCWRAAAERIAGPLTAAGLTLSFAREPGFGSPDGLERLPFVHWGSLPEARRAAFDAARGRIEAAAAACEAAAGETRDAALGSLLAARLELARLAAGRGEVVAALLTPVRDAIDVTFFQRPAAEPEPEAALDGEDGEDPHPDTEGEAPRRAPEIPAPSVEVEGVSHAQHAARTEMATRGLIRDLADAPEAALIALTAHLFAGLALGDVRSDAVLRLGVIPGPLSRDPEDGLDGAVRARLDAWRDACRATGARPLGFVAGLAPDARLRLLGELVAASVDLREPRTDAVRAAARAEAAEIAVLCGADLAARWVPDAAFLALHTRAQLADFLVEMGVEVEATALRKPELARAVAEAAAERRWIPACLRWSRPADGDGGEADAVGDADGIGADAAAEADLGTGPGSDAEPDRRAAA